MTAATGPLIPRRWGRLYLTLEFILLFGALPVWLWIERQEFSRRVIPGLLVVGLACLVVLLADPSFDRRRLWNARAIGRGLRLILLRLVPGAALLAVATAWLEPDLWMRLPREQPRIWILVMLGYPILSVYPQELIFRTFLFHRYRSLLYAERSRVLASALAFGWAHLFFANILAPVLSVVGGWLFARTYARSNSTLQSSLDHALWGDVLFTVGLGWYFYGGSVTG